jgi:hypothetical protein
MQSAKSPGTDENPIRATRKELQTLYARRSAIDALIESLQAYERYSSPGMVFQTQAGVKLQGPRTR